MIYSFQIPNETADDSVGMKSIGWNFEKLLFKAQIISYF